MFYNYVKFLCNNNAFSNKIWSRFGRGNAEVEKNYQHIVFWYYPQKFIFNIYFFRKGCHQIGPNKSYAATLFCSNIGRQCKNLKPPLYGKISLPCSTYFGSICTVECMETHYLTGSNTDTCIVAEDDTMKWKNKNQCRGKCL